VETAYEVCGFNGQVTIQNLAEYMGVTEKTARNRIKEHGGFWVDDGNIGKK
jgi:predicted ArsR family transcriptional regulator